MPNNSYIKFINFFKEHKLYDEEIFTYLRENSIYNVRLSRYRSKTISRNILYIW